MTNRSSPPDKWGRALLHGHSAALATRPARTGFNSTYRAAARRIDPLRVTAMGLAHRPPQPLFSSRHCNQVNVIGHQAVAPDLNALLTAPLGHQFHVSRIVPVVEERLLSAVATLGDVVRQTRNDQSRQSSP